MISARQLKVLGYSRQRVDREARGGRLHRIHRGVYAVGHQRLTWHGRTMAAILACEPRSRAGKERLSEEARTPAVASHWSAAWLWDLTFSRPTTIHVTVPTRRHQRRPFTVHYARLAPQDLCRREDLPATSLARTCLDVAPTASQAQLERCLQRSEERNTFDLLAFEAVLERNPAHPGRGPLSRALDIYRPDPELTRSGVERRFRALVAESGLPRPSFNYAEAGYELDAYWPELRFCVELDVYETHGSRRSFEADRLRQEELKLAGIEMIRVTGARLKREPKALAARLGALLARRAAELGAP